MKFYSILLCALLAVGGMSTAYAQDEDLLLDEPSPRPQHGLVGGGGGVIPTYLFLNTKDLNASLSTFSLPTISESGMFVMGGGAYFYTGFIKNFRIGGFGAAGGLEKVSSENGIARSTRFELGYWGISLEYIIPLGDFHIGLGSLLGGGSMDLMLMKSTGSAYSWNEILKMFEAGAVTSTVRHDLSRGFFSYQPMLSLEYVPHPLLSMRLTGGYFGTAGGSWKMNEDLEVVSVPELKMNGSFIQLGLFVGAFLSN